MECVQAAVRFNRKAKAATLALAATVMSVSPAVFAQAYPAKPVRVVVPAAPGGGLDLVARVMAGKLTEAWGQTALVENRAGANMNIGTELVARAEPDGYTLLLVASPALTINPLVFSTTTFNLQRDFAPITLFTAFPFVLIANAGLPVTNVRELIAHLRANPGKLNHGSNSASTMLLSELFKSLAGVTYQDVTYKGGVLAAAATATGETQFAFLDLGSGNSQITGGRVRALGVTTAQRFKQQPDIPTLAESGVPEFAAGSWSVVLAPARTPADIIGKLNTDIRRVLAAPDVPGRLAGIGTEPVGSSPEQATQELRREAEQWSKLVRERNIKFN